MLDPRLRTLARNLVTHSVRLARGEHLLIETFDCPDEVAIAIIEEARRAGGHAHAAIRRTRVMRALNKDADEADLRTWAEYDRERMKRMQCYLGVRGSENVSEMAGVPDAQMQRVARLYQKPVHFETRVPHTRWCVLRWPTPSMAQLAGMSTEAFENFYFDVCTLDYGRMAVAAEKLAARMRATDRVHLKGPGETDLRFSIKGIGVVPCCGNANIPDGECFTAPVKESVEGVIHFNAPTIYNGTSFTNVRLEFKGGRIVSCRADQHQKTLEAIFDTDPGARFVGEFAIGFNPYIKEPMKDILFDEKIAGSFHFTPGNCYDEANNGNKSEIHWDLVAIQRPEHGGGTIAFDDQIIRRDGLFVVDDLRGLNPDELTRA